MSWDNNHSAMHHYLYDKFIEEAVGNGKALYRPIFFTTGPNVQYRSSIDGEGRSRPRYLLCVRLAGLAVVRVRLPRWVSVRVMFS